MGFKMMGDYPYLAECAMFSSDYPHSVCLWPDSREHVAKLTHGVDAKQAEKVLAGNAARVYHV